MLMTVEFDLVLAAVFGRFADVTVLIFVVAFDSGLWLARDVAGPRTVCREEFRLDPASRELAG